MADEKVDWSDSDADGEVFWALTDREGSVTDMVDNNGIERRHAAFDSFGNLESIQYYDGAGELIEGTQPWSHSDAAQSPFLYTGRYFDRDTGLQNNTNRWYDPKTGRWMSEDPIGFDAGDPNLYRYVGNSPVNYTDPTGLASPGPGYGALPNPFWPPDQPKPKPQPAKPPKPSVMDRCIRVIANIPLPTGVLCMRANIGGNYFFAFTMVIQVRPAFTGLTILIAFILSTSQKRSLNEANEILSSANRIYFHEKTWLSCF